MNKEVELSKIIKDFNLGVINEGNLDKVQIKSSNLNRPGLELINELDLIDPKRIQIIGQREFAYIQEKGDPQGIENFIKINLPAIIYTRNLKPNKIVQDLCIKYNTPLLTTKMTTTHFMNRLNTSLELQLAEEKSVHGVFLSIYGHGILIQGVSGIGKSEIALELIANGHSLVADDRVIFKKVADKILGKAPKVLQNKLELRGIGIIDIKELYGSTSILLDEHLDLIVEIIEDDLASFDRIGNFEMEDTIFGVPIPKIKVPLRNGRNYASILETAVANFDLKNSHGIDTGKIFNESIKKNNRGEL